MSPFYNVHAAMPSLHFGWTLLFGVIFLRLLNTWLKILGLIYPVMTFFAITITGNHYILDAVGGAVLAVVSFTILELGVRHRLSLPGWGSRFRLPLSNSRRSPEV
jgi:membrane-associated phospholipid phosphatase